MPAPRSASLAKLKIEAFEDPGFDTPWGGGTNPISVQINPDSYTQALGLRFTDDEGAGGNGMAKVYHRADDQTLDLEFVFDGTGAVHSRDEMTVEARIRELRNLACRTNGRIHEPNYLILSWGALRFRGRLKSMNVNYYLFHPDGTPLRAKIKAGFFGYHENREARTELNLSSPDLTHLATVRAGDTLPLMCHRIYGDSRYYPQVAAANGLDDFRRLPVGAELVFPPLARPRR